MSIEQQLEILEEISTTIAGAFGVQPNPVVGQVQPTQKYSKESRAKQKKAMMLYPYKKLRRKNG